MKRGRSTSPPKYRLHKATGQAVITLNGKDHYLGKHGTELSHQKYKQLLADKWNLPGTPAKPTDSKANKEIRLISFPDSSFATAS